MEHVKTAQHSRKKPLVDDNVLRLFAHKLKDCFQQENVSHAKLTQEPLMMVKPVLQTFVLRGKRFLLTVHARIAQHIQELQVIEKVANHKFVPLDRFFKLMDDVLNAIHTPEQTPREKSAYHIIVMIDKNLDQMDHVLIAQTLRELKVQA